MDKYRYVVECDFTEGKYVGKYIAPKRDNYFNHGTFEFETYHDSQISTVINALLKKRRSWTVAFIVNTRIISKELIEDCDEDTDRQMSIL